MTMNSDLAVHSVDNKRTSQIPELQDLLLDVLLGNSQQTLALLIVGQHDRLLRSGVLRCSATPSRTLLAITKQR